MSRTFHHRTRGSFRAMRKLARKFERRTTRKLQAAWLASNTEAQS